LGFVNPGLAFVVSLGFLLVLLYKRVHIGITLNATALLLALLSVDWQNIPTVIYETTIDALTIAIVLATFGIMLLSQLYKETRIINNLSESASGLIKNSKIVSSLLPAIIGLLPVAGGALMSAPLVDCEAEKLGLKPEKKAYVNVWFRHTIFPVYPLSQVLIVTSALTGIAVPFIILRQIPVVAVMVIIGYLIGFWKVAHTEKEGNLDSKSGYGRNDDLRRFLIAFSPIVATIVVVIAVDAAGLGLQDLGLDVSVATLVGILVLIVISKPNVRVLRRPLKKWDVYGITLAAYGAFLLRKVAIAAGISEIFRTLVVNGSINVILLLTIVPAFLGFMTGSPSGGVAISVPILAGILAFSPATAALLYMSAYLGYLVVPTHLCFAFTVDYFKCSMSRLYRYIIPSFIITFATALLVYFLV
jgi:integral membrane protein (TIGR00529 family)